MFTRRALSLFFLLAALSLSTAGARDPQDKGAAKTAPITASCGD